MKNNLIFEKKNYIILSIGVIFIILGFLLLMGGGSEDPNVFNEDIFSPRRLFVAPLFIVTGFVIQVFSILLNKKNN